jgi:hypothetical protein
MVRSRPTPQRSSESSGPFCAYVFLYSPLLFKSTKYNKSFYIETLNFDDDIKLYVLHNANPEDSASVEMVLSWLKEKGISQLQSVYLLTQERGMSFQQANYYVMHSKAWNQWQ